MIEAITTKNQIETYRKNHQNFSSQEELSNLLRKLDSIVKSISKDPTELRWNIDGLVKLLTDLKDIRIVNLDDHSEVKFAVKGE